MLCIVAASSSGVPSSVLLWKIYHLLFLSAYPFHTGRGYVILWNRVIWLARTVQCVLNYLTLFAKGRARRTTSIMGRSSTTNLLLYMTGLAAVSFCFVSYFHLQSHPTRPESGDRFHWRIHDFMFDTPTNSSPKPYLENLTASSSNSSDKFMTPVTEGENLTVRSSNSSDKLMTTVTEGENLTASLSNSSNRPVTKGENLTASSSNSSYRFMTTVAEEAPSSVTLNKTVQGKVSSTQSTQARAHSPALGSVPKTCRKQNCAEFLSREESSSITRCAK